MAEVFQVGASEFEPFRFQLPGEKKTRELPHMQTLPIGIKAKMAKAVGPMMRAQKAGKKISEQAQLDAGMAMIELFDLMHPGLTDLVDEHQLAQLMQAWEGHSGINLGE